MAWQVKNHHPRVLVRRVIANVSEVEVTRDDDLLVGLSVHSNILRAHYQGRCPEHP